MNETNQQLEVGEKFTIATCGVGPNGEDVFNGHTEDGRPCEVVRLTIYTVAGVIDGND